VSEGATSRTQHARATAGADGRTRSDTVGLRRTVGLPRTRADGRTPADTGGHPRTRSDSRGDVERRVGGRRWLGGSSALAPVGHVFDCSATIAVGHDGAMDFDLEQTDALLSTTRAVRKRLDLDRDVPNEVLLECLQLAIQAPTGSNQQGWRWMIVKDADKKEALADLYREAGGEYLAAAAGQADAATQQGRVIDSANFLAQNLGKVPALLIPLIIGRLPDNSANAAAGLMGSIMPAMWSFQLALRSRGLGSCLTTLHLGKEAEAAALLGIPDHMTQAGLIPVAHTVGTDFKPAKRDDVASITYLDTYKNMI